MSDQIQDQHELEQHDEFEENFKDWCKQNEVDPEDESAREEFKEYWDEYGPSFWDDMDPNDRAGWEGNISKSFE